MKIEIKHMVCARCIQTVERIFNDLKVPFQTIDLGEVILNQELNPETRTQLKDKLEEVGFELLTDQETKLINNVKRILIELIHYNKYDRSTKISDLLSSELKKDYSVISKTFSRKEAITIEKYVVLQKTERAKELLSYGELHISEIAYNLNYSSAAHFSSQFKQMTGHSPSDFRKLNSKPRNKIEDL